MYKTDKCKKNIQEKYSTNVELKSISDHEFNFMLLLFFFLYPSKIIKKWIHLCAQMNETQSYDLFISNKDYCK